MVRSLLSALIEGKSNYHDYTQNNDLWLPYLCTKVCNNMLLSHVLTNLPSRVPKYHRSLLLKTFVLGEFFVGQQVKKILACWFGSIDFLSSNWDIVLCAMYSIMCVFGLCLRRVVNWINKATSPKACGNRETIYETNEHLQFAKQ